ncbi:MAG TPA: redoxin domain-containing protein [Candidatus Gallacutalibacter stercoravium]|nr:redoxin domain-containing protein [Candidatus Gallacutalibacter stercoravium]
MGLSLDAGVPAITVFVQGLLSFFSPCVFPMVPLYIGYLAGGAQSVEADGTVRYRRGKVLINTFCFVLGVSFAFAVLGMGFTAVGRFFAGNRALFAAIGGVIIILFGLYQLGVFGSGVLGKERRLPFHLEKLTRVAMSPWVALLFGFVFSFAWSPCVGPVLASVLLMASSAQSAAAGFGLIGVYTLGFVLPFLALGLFTGGLLNLFKRHQKVVRYTVKIGGVLLILMGIMMITGWMNGITGYLSSFGGGAPPSSASSSQTGETPEGTAGDPASAAQGDAASSAETPDESSSASAAPAFDLVDQNGVRHQLEDYRGKVVFLNFWATWCGPCQNEMPDIQALYERYGYNEGDVVVLGVANPRTGDSPGNADVPQEEVEAFLSSNGYTYPVLMDTTGEVFRNYLVSAFPTTFMIDRQGNVYGYISGMLTADIMENIVRQTLEADPG